MSEEEKVDVEEVLEEAVEAVEAEEAPSEEVSLDV